LGFPVVPLDENIFTKFDSGTAKNFSGFSRSSEEVKGILEISSKEYLQKTLHRLVSNHIF